MIEKTFDRPTLAIFILPDGNFFPGGFLLSFFLFFVAMFMMVRILLLLMIMFFPVLIMIMVPATLIMLSLVGMIISLRSLQLLKITMRIEIFIRSHFLHLRPLIV
jgi:hypothetical protein